MTANGTLALVQRIPFGGSFHMVNARLASPVPTRSASLVQQGLLERAFRALFPALVLWEACAEKWGAQAGASKCSWLCGPARMPYTPLATGRVPAHARPELRAVGCSALPCGSSISSAAS